MKINYDPELDVLCFRLSDGVQERDEVEPGMIVSYDPQRLSRFHRDSGSFHAAACASGEQTARRKA